MNLELTKLTFHQQLIGSDLSARWFIIRRLYMLFFRFYKEAPISENVIIEMFQNNRNPVREIIGDLISQDV